VRVRSVLSDIAFPQVGVASASYIAFSTITSAIATRSALSASSSSASASPASRSAIERSTTPSTRGSDAEQETQPGVRRFLRCHGPIPFSAENTPDPRQGQTERRLSAKQHLGVGTAKRGTVRAREGGVC
jgi:guanyl-specific ribonuclease Sa